MRFVWVHADSFLHSVASPFSSFVSRNRGLASTSTVYWLENICDMGEELASSSEGLGVSVPS